MTARETFETYAPVARQVAKHAFTIGYDLATLPYRYATTAFNSVSGKQSAVLSSIHTAVFVGAWATSGPVIGAALAFWALPALFMGLTKIGKVDNKALAALEFLPSYKQPAQA